MMTTMKIVTCVLLIFSMGHFLQSGKERQEPQAEDTTASSTADTAAFTFNPDNEFL
jgi:hypothetical protein